MVVLRWTADITEGTEKAAKMIIEVGNLTCSQKSNPTVNY